mgnify:CR=1 FL=1
MPRKRSLCLRRFVESPTGKETLPRTEHAIRPPSEWSGGSAVFVPRIPRGESSLRAHYGLRSRDGGVFARHEVLS